MRDGLLRSEAAKKIMSVRYPKGKDNNPIDKTSPITSVGGAFVLQGAYRDAPHLLHCKV